MLYESVNNYDPTQEDLDRSKRFAEEIQQTFLDGGGSKESALKLVENDIAYNMAVSVSDYSYDVSSWLFASERKPGDYTTINTTEASYFIYYLNENPEDYDWVEIAVGSLGAEAYDAAFAKRIKDSYSEKNRNNSVIAQARNHSYKIIVPYIQERKDAFALANQ